MWNIRPALGAWLAIARSQGEDQTTAVLRGVLVSCCCGNIPAELAAKTTHIYYLTILQVRSQGVGAYLVSRLGVSQG